MGKSHYKSHIVGKAGTENIASINNITALGTLTIPKISVSTSVTSPAFVSSNYIRMGAKKFIFTTTSTAATTVAVQGAAIAVAAGFAASVVPGCIALGAGTIWGFGKINVASPLVYS